ncbi:hypothetical protein Kpho02_24850 [Kitasatospora phosalacinea]|uniref:DUF4232 domain-containing protein n=1 Tax=Kitasatospora phosalacinea TaxID=2065 RepID=A0A9W6V004_9ACTN|nr:hypothetical protein [Kitasatospora phosalacinea]GLW70186.1 hypothetical protein Kpho02_24850 [Kitasatospora phosalacinea]
MTEGRPPRPGGGPSGSGPTGGGPTGNGPTGSGPTGGAPGGEAGSALTEDVLRARLHRAVSAVEPASDALPRLRVAVPRRRAVRRRALGGAVVLAAAAAVLPVVNVARPFDLSGDPAGGQAASGAGSSPVKTSGSHPGHPRTTAAVPPVGTADPSPGTAASPSASGSQGAPPAAAPLCTRTDLGRPDAQQAAADPATGQVYGWFRLTNTGAHACRLPGPGTLALGTGADGVHLLAHVVGDPAGSLPDPAGLPAEVQLGPGGSYLVRFAWVPARCAGASDSPTGPGGTQPSPAASGAAAAAAAAADTAPAPGPTLAAAAADPTPTAGPSTGLAGGDWSAAAFALGYTPDRTVAGAPLGTTLPLGCGGTVYWTGPEPDPAPPATPAPTTTP